MAQVLHSFENGIRLDHFRQRLAAVESPALVRAWLEQLQPDPEQQDFRLRKTKVSQGYSLARPGCRFLRQSMSSPEPRVLVIDDSEISLEIMSGVLEDAGMNVFRATSPIGATQLVVKHQVDVLVTDVNMPALLGQNLISLFRNNRRAEHVRVVLVSSLPEPELQAIAEEHGADGVLQKENVTSELVDLVHRVVQDQRLARLGGTYTANH